MFEQQNNDEVTLADIQREVKCIREEIRGGIKSTQDGAKIRHERALSFNAMAIAAAIIILGCSAFITEWWQGFFLVAFGLGWFIYFRRRFFRVGKH